MRSARKDRGLGLLLVGVLAGTLLVTPAAAHFTQNPRHLGVHAWNQVIKQKVYTRAQANDRYYTKTQANDRYYQRSQADSLFLGTGDVLAASVAPDGTLARSRGLVDYDASDTTYYFEFNRDISDCYPVATPHGIGPVPGSHPVVMIGTFLHEDAPTDLEVALHSRTESFVESGFNVLVIC